MVNASPWGASLGGTALRFLRAALAAGHAVPVVHFREDGVYHVLPGARTDPGAEDLYRGWVELAGAHDTTLALCSAASARRLPADATAALEAPWRVAGLAEWVGWLDSCDRVVRF